jgi:hypothetical protein
MVIFIGHSYGSVSDKSDGVGGNKALSVHSLVPAAPVLDYLKGIINHKLRLPSI